MFAKLGLVAAAALPLVHGLTLNTPTGVTSGGQTTISWTSTETDPSFSLELNHPDFLSAIAIANNIDPLRESSITIEMPTVTEFDAQYSLSAVNISNINDVFANSSDFAIAPASSTTGSSSSTGSASASGTASGASTTATSPAASSSGFGSTVSASAASSSASSAAGSSSASSPATSTSQINGALSFQAGSSSFNAGVVAAMVMSVAAGAAALL